MPYSYAVTTTNTPVFNRPDLHSVYSAGTLSLDDQKLLRCVETILFKGSRVSAEVVEHHIARIRSPEYPYPGSFYTDSRFLEFKQELPPLRNIELPPLHEISSYLEKLENQETKYIWGGNCSQGIPEMLEYYPPQNDLDEDMKRRWILQGVDCSGMLYEATGGFTPRNTSALVHFGQGIHIEKLSLEEICKHVKPLDIIVWKGHVIVVLDQNDTIESTPQKGVFKTKLYERLAALFNDGYKPANFYDTKAIEGKRFVLKRFHWATLEKSQAQHIFSYA